ncbi:uncharacterized protein LOC131931013 [Physella acuta]|uniref:uncharacterized protein LOC131931013 n=1 Tax=Physella acuta TaxID=109671 RepID=UPI0027DBB58B|nr:uncharacterized protein LOC131931013 [Physella acuta]
MWWVTSLILTLCHYVCSYEDKFKSSTTFSDYYILGVPKYENAVVEFYMSTMLVVPFQIDFRVKKFVPEGDRKVLVVTTTHVFVKKFELAVFEMDLNAEELKSIVCISQNWMQTFSVTMVFVDKTTGYWSDSILATPVSMFNKAAYVPNFRPTGFQFIVMTDGFISDIIVSNYNTRIHAWLNGEEFLIFDGFCFETSETDHAFFIGVDRRKYSAFGVIVAPCNLQRRLDTNNSTNIFMSSYAGMEASYAEYVVFSRFDPLLGSQRTVKDELIITSHWFDETMIVINEQTRHFLTSRYSMTIQIIEPMYIRASFPLYCYYISKNEDSTWGGAASLILPKLSYISSYSISVPFPYKSSQYESYSHLIFIARNSKLSKILLNDNYILEYKILLKNVESIGYQVGYVQISSGLHYSFSEDVSDFGLYLYGRKGRGTYLHPVGFKDIIMHTLDSRRECWESTSRREMFEGDLVDNDCDGYIDEETPGKDYDNDQLFSEDLKRKNAAHGAWGGWEGWMCEDSCSNSNFTKRRYCDEPAPEYEGAQCQGHNLETKNSVCGTDDCFAVDCPVGFYGKNCEHSCPNCAGGCRVVDGSCWTCKPGWLGSHCDVACPPMTYGYLCLHSCSKKCNGQDCLERVNGMCKSSFDVLSFMAIFYTVIFFTLAIMCYSVVWTSDDEVKPVEVVTVKRVSSKEFVLTTLVLDRED